MTTFHRPSNTNSPTRHATHQDSDLENTFPSSLGTQCNGYHFFLRGRIDPGGYWWPPTCSIFQLAHLTISSSTCFFVMGTFLCNCGFYTYEVVLNPYTTSRWILVATHLFQLAYFGIFHVSTSFCTSKVVLGL
jgi:hypothetical protein